MLDVPSDVRDSTRSQFAAGSVVQLADDRDPAAAVVPVIHPVTVTLSDDRVTATNGTMEWAWHFEDLEQVHHANGGTWSILVVPGVADHGVALRPEDVAEFRREFDERHRRATFDGASFSTVPSPAPTVAPRPYGPVPDGGPDPGLGPDPTLQLDVEALAPRPAPSPGPASGRAAPRSRVDRLRAAIAARPAGRARASTIGLAPPAPLAGLEARRISAWFGDHMVLDRVSLTMEAGEVTALIGPSGCGKSTFLRILNRMHELIPSAALAGEVLLDGVDVYDPSRKLTDARREIGMVFQKPNPFPAMSIYDNVVASLRLTGTKADQQLKDELVESCLSKAGLWNEVKDRLRQPGGGLSGGQQQRLCIARALAIKPRVLLMDEPCSALDPTSTRRIEQTIHELKTEVTIVIVTHNMQQALRVSDQCAFFLAEQGTPGVIVEHGDTDAMFHRPQDQRTDDYVNGRFG